MTTKSRRSDCAIANTLEILGDRWTLVVMRDAMFRGITEFGQFLQSPEGISTNILAERLQRLCDHGIMIKTPHPHDRKKYRYVLTPAGLDLAPVMLDVICWGMTHLDKVLVPPPILEGIDHNREDLIQRIKAGEVLIPFDAADAS